MMKIAYNAHKHDKPWHFKWVKMQYGNINLNVKITQQNTDPGPAWHATMHNTNVIQIQIKRCPKTYYGTANVNM